MGDANNYSAYHISENPARQMVAEVDTNRRRMSPMIFLHLFSFKTPTLWAVMSEKGGPL
jgi:hypothetical protein